jgi:FMN phosphatase YigB (HAD superfamily)
MNMDTFVFFDMAGTLVFKPDVFGTLVRLLTGMGGEKVTERMVRSAHARIIRDYPLPPTTDRTYYIRYNAMLCRKVGVKVTESGLERMFTTVKAISWQPFPDTRMLARFRYPKGIISNWDRTLQEKLAVFFPSVVFDPIVSSYGSGYAKPDSRIFSYGFRRVPKRPGRIIHVGDSPEYDIIPAREAGFEAILIDREDEYPDFTGPRVRSLSELEAMIEGWA